MNKKPICIMLLMLLITISFTGVKSSEKNNIFNNFDVKSYEEVFESTYENISKIKYDTLDQQQDYDSGWMWSVYGSTAKLAQSFIPTLSSITKVELKIKRQGNPSGLKISIRDNLDGSDLTSVYEPGTLISNSTHWHEFNFPDISITPGITYFIVWDPDGEDALNNFYWKIGDSNPYYNGNAWKYLGLNWEVIDTVEVPDPDFCFKTYGGIVGNDPPNIPSTPTGPNSGSVGESYTYSTSSTDPDGDDIKYGWDWDGDNLIDEYSNLINSGNIDSRSHSWDYPGTYYVKVKAQDENGALSGFSDTILVTIYQDNSPPNKPDTPSGASSGKTGTLYSYSTSTIDSDGDQIYYLFDWGDGSNSGWNGPHNSGDIINLSHSWSNDGTYPIKVKAKDEYDLESQWSDPYEVSMPKIKTFNSIPRLTLWLLKQASYIMSDLFYY